MSTTHAGLTTRASCLLAAGVTALACGLALGEMDLARAGLLAMAVPLVAMLVVRRSRVQIANQRGVDADRASAGESVVMHLTLSNRSRLPTGVLMLEDQLPAQLNGRARFVLDGLASREQRTVSYRLPGLPRGRYRAGPLRVRLTDPFHLVDLMRSFAATTEVVISPIIDELPAREPPRSHDIGDNAGSHSIGVHGADDASTRVYRTGDDLHKIHWRSSARTGELMVRQEERPWQGQTTILLDLRSAAHVRGQAAPGASVADERRRDSMEWAISAAASIGVHLLLANRPVDLVYDPAEPHRVAIGDPAQLREHLAGVQALPQPDLAGAAAVLARSAHDSALIAILGTPDPATVRTLTDAHPRGSNVPALALVLDSPTWAGALPEADGACEDAARILRAAGWGAVIVRRDDRLDRAWSDLVRSRTRGVLTR